MLCRTSHLRTSSLASAHCSIPNVVPRLALVPPRRHCHISSPLGSHAWPGTLELRYKPCPVRAKRSDSLPEAAGNADEVSEDELDEFDEDELEEAEASVAGGYNDALLDQGDLEGEAQWSATIISHWGDICAVR